MKKTLSRLLSLFIAAALFRGCLTSCIKENIPSSGDRPSEGQTNQSTLYDTSGIGNGEDAAGAAPNDSDFKFPRETDKLTVYGYPLVDEALRQAVSLFESLYPDVTVEYTNLGEAFEDRVRAEIPAGRGPDVLFGGGSILPDIYKTMSTGVFADLAPYMANDPDYIPEDFYEEIMNSGMMFGKQYLLPVTQHLKILVTTEELLDGIGRSPDDLRTWAGFLDACTAFHESRPDSALFNNLGDEYGIKQLYRSTGMRMIDYENSAVFVDETRFREMFDLSRLFFWPGPPVELIYGNEVSDLRENNCMFSLLGGSLLLAMNSFSFMRSEGLTPVLTAIPNAGDGFTAEIQYFAAVPEASANKLNAWRFLKVLLSEEMQADSETDEVFPVTVYPAGANPVRRSSLEKLARAYAEYYSFSVGIEEEAENFLRLMDGVTDAVMLPPILYRYMEMEMTPYIRGERSWNDCYERFLNTLELYASE